jgi:Ca-activated chloride channel family protein
MDENENTAQSQGGNETELEARIVAWVSGEASAFEVAELERLVRERPELAVFKRRISAVRDLVAEAVRPETEPLRLSGEARDKLLKAIGASPERPLSEKGESPYDAPLAVYRRKQKKIFVRNTILAMAACLVGALLLTPILVPHFGLLRKQAPSEHVEMAEQTEDLIRGLAGVENKKRALVQMAAAPVDAEERRFREKTVRARTLATLDWPKAEREATPRIQYPVAVESGAAQAAPSAAANDNVVQSPTAGAGGQGQSAEGAPIVQQESTAQVAKDESNSDKTVRLEAFTVEGAADQGHYRANSTLAGTRARADLDDVSSAITVATSQFLQDTKTQNKDDQLTQVPGAVAGKSGTLENGAASVTADLDNAGVDRQSTAKSVLVGTGSPAGLVSTNSAAPAEPAPEAPTAYAAKKTADLDALSKGSVVANPNVGRPEVAPAATGGEDLAAQSPVSTFSLHVGDVSFRLAAEAMARGERPDPAQVRPEEFYNAFDYGDPAPALSERISCRIEQAADPLRQERNLVRIAMRVPAAGRAASQALRLTVLLDTSGSMEREDRLAAVRKAMSVLVSLLGPMDRVTLVAFARQPHLLAESVPGDEATRLLGIVNQTPPEGGTNLEEALKLGGELARRQRLAGAQNRIVVLTDGAANLGDADPAHLASAVEALRQDGISFDACGVGLDGVNDEVLEPLTRKGGGRYYLVPTPESADAGFARQLAGAFRPAAEGIKVQVRFNPARVGHYRLIGFEQHRLSEQDFRNDRVGAAALAAGENAVALYEIEPLPQGEGEVGEVYVRFRDTATGSMVERSWTLPYEAYAPAFNRASPSLQLAGTAAAVAEKLRGGPSADALRLAPLEPVVNALRGRYAGQVTVQTLISMFEQLRRQEKQ